MSITLRCTCGALQGTVDPRSTYGRAVCYCKDCQAYAHFLGHSDDILDAQGGTDITAIEPGAIRFTAGVDRLACMTLTRKGPLRWYAACCRTPIANTPRDRGIAYAGLVSSCLGTSPGALDAAFGPATLVLNASSARGPVKATPLATLVGMLRIIKGTVAARITGRHKRSPFFEADSGRSLRKPQQVVGAERQALYEPR